MQFQITWYIIFFFFWWRCGPTCNMASSFLRLVDHTKRRITVGRTPLDEWSARRIDLYLTTHNTHNRKTSMPPVGFEPTISERERPQTCVLDRATTGTGHKVTSFNFNLSSILFHVLYTFPWCDCRCRWFITSRDMWQVKSFKFISHALRHRAFVGTIL